MRIFFIKRKSGYNPTPLSRNLLKYFQTVPQTMAIHTGGGLKQTLHQPYTNPSPLHQPYTPPPTLHPSTNPPP